MAVVLKNGAVFLHIPKTGGSWVTHVLKRMGLFQCSVGPRHSNWPQALAPGHRGIGRGLEHLFKRTFRAKLRPRPFTFCFVRHPLSWYESFYAFKNRPDQEWKPDGDPDDLDEWHPNARLNGIGQGRDFNEFVEAVLELHPGYVTSLYSHYTLHPCEFVGQQERLREDLAEVLSRMDCEFDRELVLESERVNTSRKSGARPEWDPALKQRVLELEHPTLVRFGYETG